MKTHHPFFPNAKAALIFKCAQVGSKKAGFEFRAPLVSYKYFAEAWATSLSVDSQASSFSRS
eukprot:3541389-Alexandrium_andersonii.AAC.1